MESYIAEEKASVTELINGKVCGLCIDAKFTTDAEAEKHMLSVHARYAVSVSMNGKTALKNQENEQRNACKTYSCNHCDSVFANLRSLRRHGREKHGINQGYLPSICIDGEQGIFLVAQSRAGQLSPIHVQKHIIKQRICCTDEDCLSLFKAAADANCPGVQCHHLDSVHQARPCEKLEVDPFYLKELEHNNVISLATTKSCAKLQENAKKRNIPLIRCADFGPLGYSDRIQYYSVYTTEKTYYSRLERVRVSFDSETGVWSCLCPDSGRNKTCLHQAVAKWYAFQHQPHLSGAFKSLDDPIITPDMDFLMSYFKVHKNIPGDIPPYLCIEKTPDKVFETVEEYCPRCKGQLDHFKKFEAVVYGVGKIWQDVTLISKRCIKCQLEVRFQDFTTGVHNFNNRILLTLNLCSTLTGAVENHVSVEAFLKTVFPRNSSIPVSGIRNGFLHFLALQNHDYDFVCLKCGANPEIVIGDGNWKNTCRRPVEAVKKSTDFSDTVNIEEVWNAYEKEIIGRGFTGKLD